MNGETVNADAEIQDSLMIMKQMWLIRLSLTTIQLNTYFGPTC